MSFVQSPATLHRLHAVETPVIHVQVCVLTYKRPELLRLALQSLVNQVSLKDLGVERLERSDAADDLAMHILIIDNDAAMSGRAVFDEMIALTDIPLRYVSEPSRGLSIARNRALTESAGMHFVAFIDDDETAHPEWIARLVDAAFAFDADVVTGPVVPQHANSPEWVKRGRFFNPQQRETGSLVPFVATNNVLLRGAIAQAFRFDSRFNATGGEDTEFFMRITRAGHRIVWVQDATVTEHIPAERANLGWLVNRARSDANRYTRSCLSFDHGPLTKLNRFVTACGGFLTGVLLLPLLVLGRHHMVRGLQLIFRSVGTISALRGQNDIYYRSSHG